MIEALLHGKLSWKQENMEDILTSNVFGLLKYAPPEKGLFRFLAKARTLDRANPLNNLTGEPESVKYDFWPQWQCVDEDRKCEPDVVLHIKSMNNSSYLVCIEAKFLSGKSSKAEVSEETEREFKDQLTREWKALYNKAKKLQYEPYFGLSNCRRMLPER